MFYIVFIFQYFFKVSLLKIFVIIQPGTDLTFLILVKVLALSEYVAHSTLACIFLWVVFKMNAPRNIAGPALPGS